MGVTAGPDAAARRALDVQGSLMTFLHVAAGSGDVDWVDVTLPGRSGPPLHIHHRADEAVFLVSGRLDYQVGDRRGSLDAGGFLMVPRGVPHAIRNPDATPARAVGTFSPGGTFAFFEALAALPPGPPDPAAIARIAAAHGHELAGPPLS